MENGTNLAQWPTAGLGASEGGRIMGQRLVSTISCRKRWRAVLQGGPGLMEPKRGSENLP